MRLAIAELRAHRGRFIVTVAGLALLFTVVLAMGGIHRGMVVDALTFVDAAGDALWLIEEGRAGPFAEASKLDPTLEERARIVPGVRDAMAMRMLGYQFTHRGRTLRATLVSDRFESAPFFRWTLAAGRLPRRARGEIAVDRGLGLPLGAELVLAEQPLRVVGLLRGAVASSGDAVAVLSETDLDEILRFAPPGDRVNPRAQGTPSPFAAAVLVTLHAAVDRDATRARLARIPGVTVFSAADQRRLLLEGTIDKARRQIELFRALLVVVSTALLALVTFSMTAAKTREIALVKLLGARTRTLVLWVASQSLLMTVAAYTLAVAVGSRLFPKFPRRVVIEPRDLVVGLTIAVALSLVASVAAVRRALAVPAGEALSA